MSSILDVSLIRGRLLILAAMVIGCALYAADPPNVPADFLASGLPAVNKALQTPVSGEFHNATFREVFGHLNKQAHFNSVVKFERLGAPVKVPTFTGTFKDTPFRTALFQLVSATSMKAALNTNPVDGRLLIAIVPK